MVGRDNAIVARDGSFDIDSQNPEPRCEQCKIRILDAGNKMMKRSSGRTLAAEVAEGSSRKTSATKLNGGLWRGGRGTRIWSWR